MKAHIKKYSHPTDEQLACFLSGSASKESRKRIEAHIGECSECLRSALSAYDSVKSSGNIRRKRRLNTAIFKKTNIYFILSGAFFLLSFTMPRYFIQLLVATLLLGIKWLMDSRSARLLVMINEAWKKDAVTGSSEDIETFERRSGNRISPLEEKPKSL